MLDINKYCYCFFGLLFVVIGSLEARTAFKVFNYTPYDILVSFRLVAQIGDDLRVVIPAGEVKSIPVPWQRQGLLLGSMTAVTEKSFQFIPNTDVLVDSIKAEHIKMGLFDKDMSVEVEKEMPFRRRNDGFFVNDVVPTDTPEVRPMRTTIDFGAGQLVYNIFKIFLDYSPTEDKHFNNKLTIEPFMFE